MSEKWQAQLVRGEQQPDEEVLFDASQRAVLEASERVIHVLGAPGTGKTTLAVELVAQAVRHGLAPDACVLLSPTRVGAGALRSRVTARVGGTSTEAIARTPQSLAFGILRARASLAGLPAPRLLGGPEQDVVLKELLAGHAQGLGAMPQWPDDLREALPTRGFRNELRDLLMRAIEWGLSSDDLRRLGREYNWPQWGAAADVLNEYDEVTALSRPGAFDPAWILGAAASALREEPDLLDRYRQQVSLVVIDDAQELTRAGRTFLDTFVSPQHKLVLIGDPDVAVQGFRGADPRLMGDIASSLDARRMTLDVGYRLPRAIDTVRQTLTTRIGAVAGGAHRTVSTRDGGRVNAALLRSAAQEAAHIAGVLRRTHLIDGVPWSDMAVIVRGSGGSAALRRALNAARVPVAVPPASLALREEPAVRPFLHVLEIITKGLEAEALPSDLVLDLLTSPLGSADPVSLRRLRRNLRTAELASDGARTSDELLAAALLDPRLAHETGFEGRSARRVGAVIAAGAHALEREGSDGDIEHVLWAMWDASGLSAPWEEAALAGGVAGTRADRDLDAILALFSAASSFVDRLPGASVADFLDHIREQDVPGDRLVAAAPDDDAVALLTPAGAAGKSWHTVVLAGVQEGVWPDLRLRGSVLGSEALVAVLSGRGDSLRAEQAAVRYDETRQFVMALSRAREQLVVTAVRDEDEQPSPFIDLVDPLPEHAAVDALREFTPVARPMTLAGVVAESRRMLASHDATERDEAAKRLARLATHDVPGADPASWWKLVELSDDRPLRLPQAQVKVSPSKIEGFNRCGLNWLLTTNGGFGRSVGSATLGTLLHEIAQEYGDTDPDAMEAALEERWPRLGLGESWVSRRTLLTAKQAVRNLRSYLSTAKADGWNAAGAEVRFNVDIGRAKISGVIDRLEKHSDRGVRVIDYKTGTSTPVEADIPGHPQLAAYQAAIDAGAFGSQAMGGAALVQVNGEKKSSKVQLQQPLRVDVDDASEVGSRAWARNLVETTAEGMGAGAFTAATNSTCTICPVRSSCPLQPEGRHLGVPQTHLA